ncbi:MAG: hypothetical protein JSV16_09780, partial [Candidatus Hydrogenedentota bacterium]
LQMINHGLSTGALFLVVGLIYERRHTRMIKDFGGLSKQMPLYAALFMIVTLSSIGLPALNGFIGEFTILIGAFKALWMKSVVVLPFLEEWGKGISTLMVLLATSGIVLGAAYMLWMYQRVMFGKLENPENMKLKDLNLREAMTLIPIVFFCFWIGLYPKPFLRFMDAAVENTVLITNPEAALAERKQIHAQAARKEKAALHAAHPSSVTTPEHGGGHGEETKHRPGESVREEATGYQQGDTAQEAHPEISGHSHEQSGPKGHGGAE